MPSVCDAQHAIDQRGKQCAGISDMERLTTSQSRCNFIVQICEMVLCVFDILVSPNKVSLESGLKGDAYVGFSYVLYMLTVHSILIFEWQMSLSVHSFTISSFRTLRKRECHVFSFFTPLFNASLPC